MATLDEIITLVRELTPAQRDQVRAFIATLRADASAPPSGWRFDFLEHFAEAASSSSREPGGMEIKVGEAICAGVSRPALWEHPPVRGAASVGYLVPIPTGVRQVALKFAIGLRDGSELPRERMVAFRVIVNGWKLWSAVKNSRAWEEHTIQMPQLGSNVARIEFVTDGLGDNRWNWAVWAEPRLEGEARE